MSWDALTSVQLSLELLEQLADAPAALPELAARVDQPPFRVRAELRLLRSDRLVTADWDLDQAPALPVRMMWRLTARGQSAVAARRQGRLLP